MKNKTVFPIILIAIAAFFVIVLLPSITNQSVQPTPTPLNQEISLTEFITTEIDFGDAEPVQITLEEPNLTAFSALQKASETVEYDLVTQQYDFGVFVQSINGYESTAEQSWIYFINGEPGNIAADQVQLKPGDTVSWRYVVPTTE